MTLENNNGRQSTEGYSTIGQRNPSFEDEPDLAERIQKQKEVFEKHYKQGVQVIARAPGRAEILGCHTDYNHGFAMAAGISKSVIALFGTRPDRVIRVQSADYPQDKVEFNIDDVQRDEIYKWTNYPRAVIKELLAAKKAIGGANVQIESTVPKSGGMSSSAAFELAIARGLLELYGEPFEPEEVARLCQRAENSDIVRSPCGFLDQGAVALAKRGQFVLFDFAPIDAHGVSRTKLIPASLEGQGMSFVIVVDRGVERQLGESGYVERRRMCEDSLVFWREVLRRNVTSLRQVTVAEFERYRTELDGRHPIMRKRVEHVVYENARVLEAENALNEGDISKFGSLLTESGKSALDLYELDEGTPELTFIVKTGRDLPGVLGMRNMGGGFSAIALALVKTEEMDTFQRKLGEAYQTEFERNLEFIEFKVTHGAEILSL